MFFNKLKRRVRTIEANISFLIIKVNSYLEDCTCDCEICGCIVRKSMAVKGKAEIRNYANKTDYIFTPYYCKRCAPKEGKDKKK